MKRGERTHFFCQRETFPPKIQPSSKQNKILDTVNNKRHDGRLFNQLRPICIFHILFFFDQSFFLMFSLDSYENKSDQSCKWLSVH
jgi:hypothetical protein